MYRLIKHIISNTWDDMVGAEARGQLGKLFGRNQGAGTIPQKGNVDTAYLHLVHEDKDGEISEQTRKEIEAWIQSIKEPEEGLFGLFSSKIGRLENRYPEERDLKIILNLPSKERDSKIPPSPQEQWNIRKGRVASFLAEEKYARSLVQKLVEKAEARQKKRHNTQDREKRAKIIFAWVLAISSVCLVLFPLMSQKAIALLVIIMLLALEGIYDKAHRRRPSVEEEKNAILNDNDLAPKPYWYER